MTDTKANSSVSQAEKWYSVTRSRNLDQVGMAAVTNLPGPLRCAYLNLRPDPCQQPVAFRDPSMFWVRRLFVPVGRNVAAQVARLTVQEAAQSDQQQHRCKQLKPWRSTKCAQWLNGLQ